ncbi:MAG: hypothetical protein ABIY35_04395, partial [Chitinophagaceae bacterium]
MKKILPLLCMVYLICTCTNALAQSDSIVLKDITWDKNAPAGMTELAIPSGNANLAGFIYSANGSQ